jgi:hypothetical protein
MACTGTIHNLNSWSGVVSEVISVDWTYISNGKPRNACRFLSSKRLERCVLNVEEIGE